MVILLSEVHTTAAVGTDLLYAAATKTGGALVHGFSRTIQWQVVRRLATGSIPATALNTVLSVAYSLVERRGRAPRLLTVATGATLSVVVSISSVGARALGTTALVLLYPRLPMARIVGADIAHVIGSVNFGMIEMLLIGSLPGIALGSRLAVRAPDRIMRFTLATVLVFVGGRLVLQDLSARIAAFPLRT